MVRMLLVLCWWIIPLQSGVDQLFWIPWSHRSGTGSCKGLLLLVRSPTGSWKGLLLVRSPTGSWKGLLLLLERLILLLVWEVLLRVLVMVLLLVMWCLEVGLACMMEALMLQWRLLLLLEMASLEVVLGILQQWVHGWLLWGRCCRERCSSIRLVLLRWLLVLSKALPALVLPPVFPHQLEQVQMKVIQEVVFQLQSIHENHIACVFHLLMMVVGIGAEEGMNLVLIRNSLLQHTQQVRQHSIIRGIGGLPASWSSS